MKLFHTVDIYIYIYKLLISYLGRVLIWISDLDLVYPQRPGIDMAQEGLDLHHGCQYLRPLAEDIR
jgi:hypothetical protein